MTALDPGYQLETPPLDEAAWYALLRQFNDASLYQTWAYGAVRWGAANLSHLVLKKDGEVCAIAQVRVVKFPLLPAGIAYVRWGGLWQRCGSPPDQQVFRQLIRALRLEYADKRGLFLRILPNIRDVGAEEPVRILNEEGYRHTPLAEGGRTVYVDLLLPLETLRANMQPRWRNYLKRAETSELTLIEAPQSALYALFMRMYREMHQRKGFVEYVDIEEYERLQQALPEDFKMKILACELAGSPHAAIVCAAAGNMGIYVLGATSDAGLNSRSSYLLHWKMLEWLKAEGYDWYDLGGINPERVPGTAQFKYGLAGKSGIDARPIGQFDTCTHALSRTLVWLADRARLQYRQLRERLSRGH